MGFYALAVFIVILCLVIFVDLRLLSENFREGTAVSSVVELVMETRRQEKNYFLYHSNNDLLSALQQSDSAAMLIDANTKLLMNLCLGHSCVQLRAALANYRTMLAALQSLPAQVTLDNADKIRDAGQQITKYARELSEQERIHLAEVLARNGYWLLGAMLLVGILVILVGRSIAHSVTRPLRTLEMNLAPIAAGQFQELPIPSQDRELVSFTGAFNRMLDELEKRRRQLLHSEKLAALGILVSGVAHELNNPLSNISTSCQLALEESANGTQPQMQEWLRQIDTQTERARRIVLALTDYACRRPLTLEPVDVNDLIAKTLLLVHKNLGRSVTVVCRFTPGLSILTDGQRLQQVLINLLKNAVDAGGPAVTITLAGQLATTLPQGRYRLGALLTLEGRRHVLMSITDDGPGMAAAVLEHIFDPFFTTREVGQGMGLGLYIVQEIVHELEGCIAVDSAPGHGTRFEMAFPSAE